MAERIQTLPEANRLWKRFGSEMNDLADYLDTDTVAAALPHPPSVTAGFRL